MLESPIHGPKFQFLGLWGLTPKI